MAEIWPSSNTTIRVEKSKYISSHWIEPPGTSSTVNRQAYELDQRGGQKNTNADVKTLLYVLFKIIPIYLF